MERRSIGKEAAIRLAEAKWWEGLSYRQIASFQLFTKELSMPFDVFHKAVEKSLGRPVWTHEFGTDGMKSIVPEFLGENDAPSFEEIMNLIPKEKRIVTMTERMEDAE